MSNKLLLLNFFLKDDFGKFEVELGPRDSEDNEIRKPYFKSDKLGANIEFINNNLEKNIKAEIYAYKDERFLIEKEKALYEDVTVNYSVLSGSANAGYNFEEFKDFDVHAQLEADILKVRAKNGPLAVGAGLDFDTGFSANKEGLSLNILGFGFSLGPKIQVNCPFLELSFDLF